MTRDEAFVELRRLYVELQTLGKKMAHTKKYKRLIQKIRALAEVINRS